jgi:hypothetical protein
LLGLTNPITSNTVKPSAVIPVSIVAPVVVNTFPYTPSVCISPTTSSFLAGVAVPIPTLVPLSKTVLLATVEEELNFTR